MPALLINNRIVEAKAILFDKDGTLVEFHQLWVGTTKSRVEELSKQMEKRQMPPLGQDERRDLAQLLGVPGGHLGIQDGRVDPYGPLIMSGPADHETLAAGFIYQRRGGPFNATLSFTREAFKAALVQQRPRLLDGAAEVLTRLRGNGWFLGIVTNDGAEQTQNVLAQLGVKEILHATVCAHEQVVDGVTKRIRKPDAEMVAKFCEEVCVAPSEVILVADSHNDLNMGPAAGCVAAIGVRSGVDTDELLKHASPDAILDSVADLLGMILIVRPADTATEINALNAFYADSSVDYAGRLAANDHAIVAEVGKNLVGCVRLCEEDGYRVMRGMCVHPQHQRLGIGTRMLAAVLPMIDGGTCWCLPFAHLESFYARAGFQEISPTSGPQHLQKRLSEHRTKYRAKGKELVMMARIKSPMLAT